ncbi:predicted protein [Plenodomus lingam JN3]|uniref:Predicted protein n=1 Tax=Leptosphaeria maculans (strain JN3 / isolate v23.1.3 / race Av1-4-5-6-7-8) TaxID=985895 RepID=E4ZMQ5_LEPMJ|nr:predicted protein [Plenodomus lingam JN3]CBX92508.1 predicted protein [Plenodomus lingam JN3]
MALGREYVVFVRPSFLMPAGSRIVTRQKGQSRAGSRWDRQRNMGIGPEKFTTAIPYGH